MAVADILENFIASTTPETNPDSPVQTGYVADAYRGDLVRQSKS